MSNAFQHFCDNITLNEHVKGSGGGGVGVVVTEAAPFLVNSVNSGNSLGCTDTVVMMCYSC